MKKTFYALSLVVLGIGLGATLLRDQVPVASSAAAFNATEARLQNERNTMQIVDSYEAGLVLINTEEEVTHFSPFWFGSSEREVQKGVGSGFFINKQGDILTNFHVVVANNTIADRITIRLMNGLLADGQSVRAKVVGLAPQYDLALLKPVGLSLDKIKPIPLGVSASLKVGQKAIAMGAPFGLDFSVSEGIISSTSRQIPLGFSGNGGGIVQRVIQTDAAINPGNSGGPLLDSGGKVIGINTQIRTGGVGQSAGVGFAIPVDAAKDLLPRLQSAGGGIVTAPRLGITAGLLVRRAGEEAALGLSVLTEQGRREFGLPDSGLLVGGVESNSPAGRAGLLGGQRTRRFAGGVIRLGGDVIVAADGRNVDSLEDLQAILLSKKVGDEVVLNVFRTGQLLKITLILDRSAFE